MLRVDKLDSDECNKQYMPNWWKETVNSFELVKEEAEANKKMDVEFENEFSFSRLNHHHLSQKYSSPIWHLKTMLEFLRTVGMTKFMKMR